MHQKGIAIILCACVHVLLCVDCTAASHATEDTTAVHRISELHHSVSSRRALAVSHDHHTRKDLESGTDNGNTSMWNCSQLYDSSNGYNESSCRFVQDNCQTKAHLINYLSFMKCDLPTKMKARNSLEKYVVNYSCIVSAHHTACRVYTTDCVVLLSHFPPCYNSKFLVNSQVGGWTQYTFSITWHIIGGQFLCSSSDIPSWKTEALSQHCWNYTSGPGKWWVVHHVRRVWWLCWLTLYQERDWQTVYLMIGTIILLHVDWHCDIYSCAQDKCR